MKTQTDELPLLYLSSGSPRRQELMQQLNLKFKVINVPIEEQVLPEEDPEAYVTRIAIKKAQAGFDKVASNQAWIIGGDTAVVLGDEVFGKPESEADAYRMLSLLSGQTHTVLSAIAIVRDTQVFSALNQTQVTFRVLSEQEMTEYWSSGEPIGKAGSYAIQGLGARFIKNLQGSYSGVMGLPLYELDQLLTESGYYNAFV
ncbi:MAG: Maf family protein [Pseudomonadota bacterium]|nr:Maf family protein [Pseudomonadota bacterium]